MTRNRTQLWATLTAFAGIVALGVVVAFQTLPEVKEAGACAANDAVLRFELAKTQADLEAIFDYRAARVAKLLCSGGAHE